MRFSRERLQVDSDINLDFLVPVCMPKNERNRVEGSISTSRSCLSTRALYPHTPALTCHLINVTNLKVPVIFWISNANSLLKKGRKIINLKRARHMVEVRSYKKSA